MSEKEATTLEKIKFAVMQELEKSEWAKVVDSVEISEMARWQYDTICLMVRGHIWGETGGHREIRYPRDWREAVRERWLPAWVKAIWPVRYTVIDVTAKVTYPDLRVSLPSEPHRIVPYIRREEEDDDPMT